MSSIAAFAAEHGNLAIIFGVGVLMLGGLAKGMVGFAFPMIAISGLGAFLPAPTAVALLIVPALATNIWQTLRVGWEPALGTLRRFWILNIVLAPTIALSAHLLTVLDDKPIFLLLGVAVTGFSLIQLFGLRMANPGSASKQVEGVVGLISGFFGGISGVWGPPIVIYLTARGVAKDEQMRAMGLSFVIGAAILVVMHLSNGVLNTVTAPLSIMGLAPVMLGMAVGLALHDRMDQTAFRRATLVVLVFAGLNLLRRGIMA